MRRDACADDGESGLVPQPASACTVHSISLMRPDAGYCRLVPLELAIVTESPASSSPPGERLDSWKEIARYLGRDESTVQRWEKREGMPVHRHVHTKRGSVYAYRAELDAWWQGRRQQLEPPKSEEAAEPTASTSTLHSSREP